MFSCALKSRERRCHVEAARQHFDDCNSAGPPNVGVSPEQVRLKVHVNVTRVLANQVDKELRRSRRWRHDLAIVFRFILRPLDVVCAERIENDLCSRALSLLVVLLLSPLSLCGLCCFHLPSLGWWCYVPPSFGWCCFSLPPLPPSLSWPHHPKEGGEGASLLSHAKSAGGEGKKAPPPFTRKWVTTTTHKEEEEGGGRGRKPTHAKPKPKPKHNTKPSPRHPLRPPAPHTTQYHSGQN